MVPLFRLGQVLKGRIGQYTITKQLQETVWLAKNEVDTTVVIKGVQGHFRVRNEGDVLKRLQSRSPYIRPLVDEVIDPPEPPIIVLRHLDDRLLKASIRQKLNRTEVKYVSKRILEALKVLHEDGFVHTDVKPDNVLVNYAHDGASNRFTDVQLADFGSTYRADSKYAKEGAPIGAPIWRSPEALFKQPWNAATDVWSFGALLISLIIGGDFSLFQPPDVSRGHEEHEFRILMRQFQFFGPFSPNYHEIVDRDTIEVVLWFMEQFPKDEMICTSNGSPRSR